MRTCANTLFVFSFYIVYNAKGSAKNGSKDKLKKVSFAERVTNYLSIFSQFCWNQTEGICYWCFRFRYGS